MSVTTLFDKDENVDFCSDDPKIVDGTPVGLQFVGRRLQEEKMIAIAELFEKALPDESNSSARR